MCYSYHHQFRGKKNLFVVDDLNPYSYPHSFQRPWDVLLMPVIEIGEDIDADYSSTGTSASYNDVDDHGDEYGDNRGYSTRADVDYGSDWLKGKHAYDHIKGERPCMVQFDSDGDGKIDHSVAIEGVKYDEMRRHYVYWFASWYGIWYNDQMWYHINYGWGNKRAWICVDDNYKETEDVVKNTGNIYLWVHNSQTPSPPSEPPTGCQ